MDFRTTPIEGVVVVTTEQHRDDRGWFARSWCEQEFREAGLPPLLSQANLSHNHHRHTLRGMHWQQAPSLEAKLVRAVHGSIFDVVVDLRPESATHGTWFGLELTAGSAEALFIPANCAHGFLTLEAETLVHYHMGAPHEPALARGFRWDDPAVAIGWPHPPAVMSPRDRALPLLADVIG